jgi:hypothetical protein
VGQCQGDPATAVRRVNQMLERRGAPILCDGEGFDLFEERPGPMDWLRRLIGKIRR